MSNWLRRVRGAVGLGLIWAGFWATIGAVLAVLPGGLPPGGFPILPGIFGFSTQFAAIGFIGGAAFSAVLSVAERKQRIDQISLPRFAAWGTLGGLLMLAVRGTVGWAFIDILGAVGIPAFNWLYGISGTLVVVLGAGCATASLAVAQRVASQEMLETRARVDEVGLSEKEVRELL